MIKEENIWEGKGKEKTAGACKKVKNEGSGKESSKLWNNEWNKDKDGKNEITKKRQHVNWYPIDILLISADALKIGRYLQIGRIGNSSP